MTSLLARKFRLLAVALAVVIGSMASASPAQAHHTSRIDNRNGDWSCLSWYPGHKSGEYCYEWMPDGTRFLMRCWTDHQSFYGNYWSNRWFYGQSFNTGRWGYVHSSYVYEQKSVPRC